ncbi:TorF family putative porin [Stutzerimonas tarimensis]|uniref:TorF family putative porin n=1 Tax=Stutzerimonas tarimensis TaxID=1507735 RepID=A0ABV7T8L8_9GAMM
MFSRQRMLAILVSLAATTAEAQMMARDLGSFELQMGTIPGRSMAQGLVQPASHGAFHGGLDLNHASGWYFGQWQPATGFADGTLLELNSYLGYARPFAERPGYEVGVIRYTFPDLRAIDRHAFYGGLTLDRGRFGASVSHEPWRTDSTLLMDFDLSRYWGVDLSLKYSNHALAHPAHLPGGRTLSSFNDWSLNLSRHWRSMQMGMTYTGTDVSGTGCMAYAGHNEHCEDFFMLRFEKTLR